MKYCEEYAALLDALIDGACTEQEAAEVREHLQSCEGCRAYVDQALAIRDAFPEIDDVTVPDGFADGIMAAIRAQAAPRRKRHGVKFWMSCAACLVLVVGVVYAWNIMGGFGASAQSTAAALPDSVAITAVPPQEEIAIAPDGENGSDTGSISSQQVYGKSSPDPSEVPSGNEAAADPGLSSSGLLPGASSEMPILGVTEGSQQSTPYAKRASVTLSAAQIKVYFTGYSSVNEDHSVRYELTADEFDRILTAMQSDGITVTVIPDDTADSSLFCFDVSTNS